MADLPYPQISQAIKDPAAQKSLRLLWERYGNLLALVEGLKTGQGLDAGNRRVINVGKTTKATGVVTKAQADSTYLTPNISTNSLLDLLFKIAGGLLPWLLQQLGAKGKPATTYKPAYYSATLYPDTRPTGLGDGNIGAYLYATDFDRLYLWNGTGWEDAPGQPERRVVAMWLNTTATIPTGWHLCDNTSTRISNSDATTSIFIATLVNDSRFLLPASTGGVLTGSNGPWTTGFESTDDTDNQYLVGGTSLPVAAHNHTHSFSSLIPPYVTVLPIIRL